VKKASILSKASAKGKKVGTLKKGKSLTVTGAKGKYYKVKYLSGSRTMNGYIPKKSTAKKASK
jgi:hypothetical protein